MRGAGKSTALEYFGQYLYLMGWTGLDLWAPPNAENFFYAINLNHKSEHESDVKIGLKSKFDLHCNCNRTFPIMILCPDTKKFDQYSLDVFNDYVIKSREWWIDYCRKKGIFPIEWHSNMIGKKIESSHESLITVKYIPEPSYNGSNHNLFRKIIIESILECRDQGRILTFNPILWENELPRFKAIDLIMRLLEYVKNTYFLPQPDDVLEPIKQKIADGKAKRLTLSELHLLHWDKMYVIAREFGELTASNLRSEASSTITKRAFLSFIRRSRHAQITLLGDYQNPSDVFPSIRDQADIFLIKRAPKNLFGQGWEWLFETIEKKRQQILEYGNYTEESRRIADTKYPRIEQLANNYLYAVFPDNSFVLKNIPSPDFHHKQAHEHFRILTGITWENIAPSKSKTIEIDSIEDVSKQVKSAASISYSQLIKSLVSSTADGGKGMTYKEAYDTIMKMAEKGEIPRPTWSRWDSMFTWYKRNTKSSVAS